MKEHERYLQPYDTVKHYDLNELKNYISELQITDSAVVNKLSGYLSIEEHLKPCERKPLLLNILYTKHPQSRDRERDPR